MSTHSDDHIIERSGEADFEHALKSLRPRATANAQAILALASAEDKSAPAASEAVRRPARQLAWPLLTALSWLITVGVWWNATPARGPNDSPMMSQQSLSPSIGDAARTVDDSESTGVNQLGGLLTATIVDPAPQRDVPPPVESRPDSESNPIWLSLLGFDAEAFRVDSAEDRWDRLQAQADVAANIGGEVSRSREHESATYSSLRDEFNTPIRTDWFSR